MSYSDKELLNKAIDQQRKVVEYYEATGENDEGYNATLYLGWLIELRDLRAEIDRLENEKSWETYPEPFH